MTRAALRKAQHNLFAPGPAAALAPQPPKQLRHDPMIHYCQAPGCTAWGAFGFSGGRWFCGEHREIGEAA